jgi:predicted ribosomally synthesized peptide with nif11-like leader
MSKEQLTVLIERINSDADLQAKFKGVSSTEEFNALVAELGVETSADDLIALVSEAELGEAELAGVSGGVVSDAENIFKDIGGQIGGHIGGAIDVIVNPGGC